MYSREDSLIESGYVFNPSEHTLEHFYQQPPDYKSSTYQSREVLLEGLSYWTFTYWDGQAWQNTWPQPQELPRMVKVNFKFEDDNKDQEFAVNIPIGP
ncbi:MAG: type II secretion system protein GspJ [Candidatus Omnitrophica bacterium]|nr:type II secretion system protein GspJ [Candidatus Omnitrophota bacterium]MDD5553820.1 type II secretion system protein GspJ [Candidatus Omnitrophota bacterium]